MQNKNAIKIILAAVLPLILTAASTAAPLTHLPDGGFEKTMPNGVTVEGWNSYGAGYAVDSLDPHGGAQCLRCDSADTTSIHGAVCNQELDQTTATSIVISGWSKASGVGGSPDLDYSIYCDIQYTDGAYLYGQLVSFDVGTHGWQQKRLVINPAKPIKSISVYALFRHHTGTVWFDDFDAHEGGQ